MYSGAEIKDWVILIAGNVFIAILVVRMISHYAKREWGEIITNFLIAAFIAWIVYSTDTFISFLKWLVNRVTGGAEEALPAVDHGAGALAALDLAHTAAPVVHALTGLGA